MRKWGTNKAPQKPSLQLEAVTATGLGKVFTGSLRKQPHRRAVGSRPPDLKLDQHGGASQPQDSHRLEKRVLNHNHDVPEGKPDVLGELDTSGRAGLSPPAHLAAVLTGGVVGQ